MNELATELKRLRDRKGINKTQLAKLLGITIKAVSEIERSVNSASPYTVKRLKEALDLSDEEHLHIALLAHERASCKTNKTNCISAQKLGQLLAVKRLVAGLTQKELGLKLNELTGTAVSKFERLKPPSDHIISRYKEIGLINEEEFEQVHLLKEKVKAELNGRATEAQGTILKQCRLITKLNKSQFINEVGISYFNLARYESSGKPASLKHLLSYYRVMLSNGHDKEAESVKELILDNLDHDDVTLLRKVIA